MNGAIKAHASISEAHGKLQGSVRIVFHEFFRIVLYCSRRMVNCGLRRREVFTDLFNGLVKLFSAFISSHRYIPRR